MKATKKAGGWITIAPRTATALSIAVMRRSLPADLALLPPVAARGRGSHQRHVINVPYKVYLPGSVLDDALGVRAVSGL